MRLSMVDQSYFVRDFTRSLAWTPLSGVLRVWARRITDACVCVSWWPRFAPELVPRAVRILLKAGRCDAAMGLADAFWTVKRSLNYWAVWGRFGSDGAQGRYLPSSAGAIDAGDPAPESTPAEGTWRISGSGQRVNTKLARYMASVIEARGERAACEIDPVSWRVAQTLTAVCYGDNGLGLPMNLAVPEIENIPYRYSICCLRISRSSAV